jgi:intein-encoded DNA endonuclease-like protein
MNTYHLDDEVKYIDNDENINQGTIVRYFRNGNILLKNKNEECIKIMPNKIVGNMTIINDLINYTKNLEFDYNDKIEYIRQLQKENEEICSVFTFVVSCLIIIICILPYIYIYR